MNSSSDTGWTTRSAIATSRTFASLSLPRRSLQEHRLQSERRVRANPHRLKSVITDLKPHETSVTAADLERVAQNGELPSRPDTLITPLAREEAERRGITFRIVGSQARTLSGAALKALA
jgi:hypothetical protein